MAQNPGNAPIIPASATQRLRSGLFTSDLTVDELVCLEDINVEPLGLVLGSSIYHVGLQVSQYGQNMEMTVLSQAMYGRAVTGDRPDGGGGGRLAGGRDCRRAPDDCAVRMGS